MAVKSITARTYYKVAALGRLEWQLHGRGVILIAMVAVVVVVVVT